MKKFFIISIILILCVYPVFAEPANYSSLSFEDLFNLKQEIDREYNSRPESEGFTLSAGTYTVGKDIIPGMYFVGMVTPDKNYANAFAKLYESKELFDSDPSYSHEHAKFYGDFDLGDKPKTLVLEENNILYIGIGTLFFKASEYDPSEYFVYTPPEGILVTKGEYIIGSDIPAGKYDFYPATLNGGEYQIIRNIIKEDGSIETKNINALFGPSYLYVLDSEFYETLDLIDGDNLKVNRSVIMVIKASIQ